MRFKKLIKIPNSRVQPLIRRIAYLILILLNKSKWRWNFFVFLLPDRIMPLATQFFRRTSSYAETMVFEAYERQKGYNHCLLRMWYQTKRFNSIIECYESGKIKAKCSEKCWTCMSKVCGAYIQVGASETSLEILKKLEKYRFKTAYKFLLIDSFLGIGRYSNAFDVLRSIPDVSNTDLTELRQKFAICLLLCQVEEASIVTYQLSVGAPFPSSILNRVEVLK